MTAALPLWLFSSQMSELAAQKKGLHEIKWLVAALLFGPFAIFILAEKLDLKRQQPLRLLVDPIGPIESNEDEVD